MQTTLLSRCLFFGFLAIFLTEFLDSTRGVYDFLLSRIERMTDRAHFDMQGLAHGGTCLESVAATARHRYFLIIGMNS
jgi:hypothetical protein